MVLESKKYLFDTTVIPNSSVPQRYAVLIDWLLSDEASFC